MAVLIIYSVAVGIAAALWAQVGIWAWPHAKLESLVYLLLAALNLYALAYTASRIFGTFVIAPVWSRFLLLPIMLAPPILLFRAWKFYRRVMARLQE